MEFSQHYFTEQKRWGGERDPKAWYYDGSSEEWANSHGNVDKVLYQDLVEMIPLLELFMNQQWNQNKRFSHHASLVYTPAPSRCSPKKASEHRVCGKTVRQLFCNTLGDAKDGFLRDGNEGSPTHAFEDKHLQDIATVLAFPSDQAGENIASKAEFLQLQSQIEQLEQKLKEKDIQLHSTESSVKKDLAQLQTKVEELDRELWDKDQKIEDACKQLSGKQEENLRLLHLLERAESSILESDRKAAMVEEELCNMRCQMAAFFLQLENKQLCNTINHQQAVENSDESSLSKVHINEDDQEALSHSYKMEEMDSIRRRYLAAVIALRESPSEELLLLLAEFRKQLQSLLMEPSFSIASDDFRSS